MKHTDIEMAQIIAQKVKEHGGQTFYVGGFVRDKILGRENKDVDIEIHGIKPETLKEILTSIGKIDERKVGENFGIMALYGYDVDIAMPRSEETTGAGGHKDFIIQTDPFIGTEKAASRRDFTINALMQDVVTGEILDFFGGQEDLQNGVVRHINEQAFADDPLRTLRAAQFAARFGFQVADETIELAKQTDLSKLSHERIAAELDKALLKSEKPSEFFNALRKMNCLDVWFPEVQALIDCPQDPSHHPEGDVYNHTMQVLDNAAKFRDQASNPRAFMLAALCHDFGKPQVTEYNEKKNKYTAYGHDKAGVQPALDFIEHVYNNKNLAKYVSNMTLMHMRPTLLFGDHAKNKEFMKMFDTSISPQDLVLLNKCDRCGRDEIQKENEMTTFLTEQLKAYQELIEQPEVTGKDLIKLGYEDKLQYKEMLSYTHQLHLSGMKKDTVIRNMMGQFGKPGHTTKQPQQKQKTQIKKQAKAKSKPQAKPFNQMSLQEQVAFANKMKAQQPQEQQVEKAPQIKKQSVAFSR